VWIAGHERILAEPLVGARVGNDKQIALLDGVRAEGDAARRLGRRQAAARLEPLPVGVDQRNESNRRVADERRERRQIVEGRVRFAVENVVPAQRCESGRFIRGPVTL